MRSIFTEFYMCTHQIRKLFCSNTLQHLQRLHRCWRGGETVGNIELCLTSRSLFMFEITITRRSNNVVCAG